MTNTQSEQQQEMRREFEKWAVTMPVDKWHIGADNIRKNQSGNYVDPKAFYAWKGFQAAYRPKLDVEVVARSICKADMVVPDELSLGSGKPRWTQYTRQAQAAINAIFKEQI